VIDPKQARTSRGDLDISVRANSGGTVQAGSDRVPAVHWHMASTRSLPVPQAFRPVEPVEPIETRSPSRRTLWGLDGLNFLLADVQTGVGPFLAIYLAGYTWNEERVGLALTAGGIAGILTQTPAGGLVDFLRSKRALVGVAVAALAGGAFLIALFPSFWPVMGAQILIGGTSSVFIPAICAMSLGIVGRTAFDARQGRNQTFNSAGNVVAALSMGLLGYLDSNRSIFFFVVALALPTILVLLLIQPADIDYEMARGADERQKNRQDRRASCALFRDRPLVIFLICAVMFHFANAAMLPLFGEMLAKGRGRSSMMFMSACVVTTTQLRHHAPRLRGRDGKQEHGVESRCC
jgi:predicted MFS family arabinose efflux permease